MIADKLMTRVSMPCDEVNLSVMLADSLPSSPSSSVLEPLVDLGTGVVAGAAIVVIIIVLFVGAVVIKRYVCVILGHDSSDIAHHILYYFLNFWHFILLP